MVGKHAVPGGRLRSALSVTVVGVRELFVFAALGVAAPVALLVALPALTAAGTAMEQAPICETTGRDCLELVPASLTSPAGNRTWVLSTATGDAVTLAFPSGEPGPESTGPLHVLVWNDEPVALLQADGKVVGSLAWGRLNGVSETALLLAPLWPLGLIAFGWLLLRRHGPRLVLLTIVALGAAIAGPGAFAGMQLFGYRGLVAGGLTPLAVAFLVAGLTLGVMRLRAKPVRRTEAPVVRVPEQRHESVGDAAGVRVDLR